ncbi:MAG: NUDIX hydrolase [Sphingobium sp.]
MTDDHVAPNISRPAATLIILRENGPFAPKILIVQRALTMAFAAGALVFPGGAVDPDDAVIAQNVTKNLPVDEASARVAAIRETLEESGIAPGLGMIDAEILASLRAEMGSNSAFSTLLQQHKIPLHIDAIIPFARWHPAPVETVRRIFDTRFYLARYDEAGPEPSVDDTEHVDLFWETAAGVLDRCDAGQGHIIFPTRRNLERLAQFDSIAAIEQHARTTPVEKIVPWVEERPNGRFLCIPDHLGYPICSEQVSSG